MSNLLWLGPNILLKSGFLIIIFLFYPQTFVDMEGSGFGDVEGARVSVRNTGRIILQSVPISEFDLKAYYEIKF